MRALVVLLTVVFVIAAGHRIVEGALAEPVTGTGSCVGGRGPIGAEADCLEDPDSPNVDELGHDPVLELEPCDDPQLRLEDAVYADVGGGELTCP